MPRKRPKPVLKPSGYDVVIRDINAIRAINAKIGRARPSKRDGLMTEKDRLIDEMQAACPHESILRCDGAVSGLFGPKPVQARLCTSCGQYEQPQDGRFKALSRKKGRAITRVERDVFAARLGKTLIFTGINAPSR